MKTPIGAFLTVLSLSLPAVAAIPTEYHVKGESAYASLSQQESFSYNARNLKQGLGTELPMGGGTLIAQAQLTSLRSFTLRATTNSDGFFSAPHGLQGDRIEGILVAVQHLNGNWHTLEFSNLVDNRFWWNNSNVEGIINSPNFDFRPVKIIVFVRR